MPDDGLYIQRAWGGGKGHQSTKGNDWHFGMKAYIGVDAASGLVHTVIGTAGNVADVTKAGAPLHSDEIGHQSNRG
jgi:IS5 family transposase